MQTAAKRGAGQQLRTPGVGSARSTTMAQAFTDKPSHAVPLRALDSTPAEPTIETPLPAPTHAVHAMLSDPGRIRQTNEDACGASPEHGAFLVCDGMGGAAAGEVASQLARDTFLQSIANSMGGPGSAQARLEGAVRAANQAVHRYAQRTRGHRGMGTTLAAVVMEHPADGPSPLAWVVHVGDSRCYRLRGNTLELLTEDHSLVEEHVRAGLMTRADAENSPIRNIITRAIGTYANVEPEIAAHAVQPGDLFLLASDGLTRELDEDDIAQPLRAAAATADGPESVLERALQIACSALVEAANAHGGADNITVLLVGLAQPPSR